jgi:hypothetical protein
MRLAHTYPGNPEAWSVLVKNTEVKAKLGGGVIYVVVASLPAELWVVRTNPAKK